MDDLHAIARECSEIAERAGFQRVTWENAPIKILMVYTELDELEEAETHEERAEELADVAIRLLGILRDIRGDEWASRVNPRTVRKGTRRPALIETQVQPIRHKLRRAVEAWRRDNQKDAMQWCELALLEAFRTAWRMEIDLHAAILAKMGINRGRPRLHGKVRDAG